jgi:hypothetical protein
VIGPNENNIKQDQKKKKRKTLVFIFIFCFFNFLFLYNFHIFYNFMNDIFVIGMRRY